MKRLFVDGADCYVFMRRFMKRLYRIGFGPHFQ